MTRPVKYGKELETLNIQMTKRRKNLLRQYAFLQQCSMSDIINEAITFWAESDPSRRSVEREIRTQAERARIGRDLAAQKEGGSSGHGDSLKINGRQTPVIRRPPHSSEQSGS